MKSKADARDAFWRITLLFTNTDLFDHFWLQYYTKFRVAYKPDPDAC